MASTRQDNAGVAGLNDVVLPQGRDRGQAAARTCAAECCATNNRRARPGAARIGVALAVLVVSGLAGTVPAYASSSGVFDALGGSNDVGLAEIAGRTYALVASSDGMQVIDVTEPSEPLAISGIFGEIRGARDIEVAEIAGRTYALVASWNDARPDAAWIVNVTDPASPATLASIPVVGRPHDVEIAAILGQTYALITDNTSVLLSDVTDPTAPSKPVPVFDTQGRESYVAIAEVEGRTYALVADLDRRLGAQDGIHVVNITDPTKPSEVGGLDMDSVNDIEVAEIGGRAYAIATRFHSNVVEIFDIAKILDGELEKEINLLLNEGRLEEAGLLLDGKDAPVGEFGVAGDVKDIRVAEMGGRTYALVAAMDGMQIVDITNPTLPSAANGADGIDGGFVALDGALGIEIAEISGRTFALAAASDGMQVINVTDPATPTPVAGVFDMPGGFTLEWADDIEVAEIGGRTYALVAAPNPPVINVTDPAAPILVATMPSYSSAFQKITTTGGHTYVFDGVHMINITNPTAPTIATPTQWHVSTVIAEDMEIAEIGGRTYALVAGAWAAAPPASTTSGVPSVSGLERDVRIIDVTDPTIPPIVTPLLGAQGGLHVVGIAAIGEKTYGLTSLGRGIQIIDITDPSAPAPIASIFDGQGGFDALAGASGIEVAEIGGRTYALVAASDMQIIDITDPSAPAPIASIFDGQGGFDALAGASGIEVAEIGGRTYALVAGWDDGAVQIIDITDPSAPAPIASIFDGQGGFDALAGARDIAVAEISGRTYAMVTGSSDSAVQIIDITDPSAPAPIASIFDGQGGFDALAEETNPRDESIDPASDIPPDGADAP